MNLLKLSQLPSFTKANDAIDYLIDNGYQGIINDFSEYLIEYELDDILLSWNHLITGLW